MTDFSLKGQIKKELHEFFTTRIQIAGMSNDGESARYLNRQNRDYTFNQWEMVNLIDLYYNSKFESGQMDSEGQRKLFLNTCKFRADVSAKQVDLDVKDFVFVPDEGEGEWGPFLMQRDFKEWAREEYLSELLNINVENYPRYGWTVNKVVGGKPEFVPLRTLRNQQDAKSLNTARYVIIEHPDMTLDEMQSMKSWDTSGLDMEFDEKVTVQERYGFAPRAALKLHNGEEPSDEDYKEIVDTLAIVTWKKKEKGKDIDSNTLFFEEVTERPFVEAHWTKVHGRLMGVGEIENQLENQIGYNMMFNLYRRQLLWSSKKIFQSKNETVAKNFVRDVKDGDVLEVGMNGEITQVDMGNRAAADFANFGKMLETNSDQKSFTYEVATGQALPSGTPFRLGVTLSNAVNSHFDLKREKLGLMFKRMVLDYAVPSFKKTNTKAHTISMFADEEGFEALKQAWLAVETNEQIRQSLMKGTVPDVDKIKQSLQNDLDQRRVLNVDVPANFYDTVKFRMTLEITGEEIDLPKKIETLTNVYTSLAQAQDPRAEKVLARLMSYTGENFDLLVGPKAPPQPQQPQQQPAQGAQPQLSPIQPSTMNQPTTQPQTL